MKTVLVTGFEPFGGDSRNPAGEIARALDGSVVAGHRVHGVVLPCTFGGSRRALLAAVRRLRPGGVICLGLAAGRREITPERIAINVDDARIPDNAGRQPIDRPVVRGGPAAYWSTLPLKAIVAALRRRGLPASVSQTAGTFVCNHVFYALMHALRDRRAIRGGFVHVPWPADWAGHDASPVSFAQMIGAVKAVVAVSVQQRRDVRRRGGAEA